MNNSLKMQIFMDLLEKHEKYLKRFIYSRVYNAQDAEDIFQDTLYLAYKSFEQLKEINCFNAWINQIAVHIIYDKFKKKKHSFKIVSLDEINEKNPDSQIFNSNYSVEKEIISDFEKINVRKLINKLSYRERVFFHFYYEEEYTMEQIAKKLGVKVSTLWALHSRMKDKLRRREEIQNERR